METCLHQLIPVFLLINLKVIFSNLKNSFNCFGIVTLTIFSFPGLMMKKNHLNFYLYMFLRTATLKINWTNCPIKNTFHFQILPWNYKEISFLLTCILNELTAISIFTVLFQIQNKRQNLLFTVKLWDWVVYVQKKTFFINLFVKWNHGFHKGNTRKSS